MSGERVLLRQLDLFLFAVCLIRCPFMELPVGERREGGGGAFFAVLLTERGRAGGRQRYEKRCEECNYEFPA